ncbi:ABC transporter thiamine pyrophosphate-binding lipoprotein p37/Cypl [[Mycoplasma] testudinis]|uniref:ABC transporter thiamine pyrophosphate-binding lipoprotein p37/Cypl n=1 Tax=[Mycoplasma] testudinis TaxID=33924 RepID=UPI000489F0EB|nr:hypothetical protein [[Mycoplasma] testudinis]
MANKNIFSKGKKLFFSFFVVAFGLTVPVIVSACGGSQGSDNSFKMDMDGSWWIQKTDSQAVENYQKLFNQTFDEIKNSDQKYKGVEGVNLKINPNVSDSVTKLTNVMTGKSDFSFVNMATVSSPDAQTNKNFFEPYIQTLTQSWTYDSNETYFDQDQGKSLMTIGQKATDAFNKTPYQSWDSDKEWDGAKYKKFYGEKLVRFYRGMIMIYGNPTELANIKKAWTDKDWKTFSNFGILHDKTSSAGGYLLEQALIRKQFGFDASWSLIDNLLPAKSEQKSHGGYLIGQDPNFRIAFDDEGSWAWQKNGDPSYFNPKDAEAKIEVLSVTDPLFYDYGIFNSKFKDQPLFKELILKTFQNLSQKTTDQNIVDGLGFYSGYNGYDLSMKYNEIVSAYNKSIN